ncbi:glycosyltransferase family 4 protein [Palaeococcus ferrophilus]|uniref:glycosyltransferase family 4 protein n=1 Tax=Palaeococcus ferrophilus TaxID=83868 RepID=UPI0014771999|nr:glycosyltransferase family 4 protein [Palaeococcus ferrophilus]
MEYEVKNNKKINAVFLSWYFPKGSGGFTYRKKLLTLLSSLESIGRITVLTSDNELKKIQNSKIRVLILNDTIPKNPLSRFLKFLLFQFKTILHLIKLSRDYSMVFVMAGNNFTFPVLFSKFILKKKIVYLMSGVGGMSVWKLYSKNLLSRLVAILDELVLLISDFIILESPGLKDTLKLDRYRGKVIQNGRMYVESEKMQYITPFSKRATLVGYIGRLSPEKGIVNFIHGILKIFNEPKRSSQCGFNVIIGGKGPLESKIRELVIQQNDDIKMKIKILGYIPDNELINVLNKLRLLVFPSPINSLDGLPNIILEAMACGTPVLATSTGAILDVIIDETTGFIMGSNSPGDISRNIKRALMHPELLKISKKGMESIRKEFSFDSALRRWERIISTYLGEGKW